MKRKINIFSEIYGAYYRTAAKILEKGMVGKSDIYNVISEEAFLDSALFIPQKLVPSDGFSEWGLLEEKDGGYKSVLKHKPVNIVTTLQKRWIKAQLADPKFRLFLEKGTLDKLDTALKDVKPLFNIDLFRTTDAFSDGDPYCDENYIKNFRVITKAMAQGEAVDVSFLSSRNERKHGYFIPLRMEYSRKNDKFRVYCIPEGAPAGKGGLINMGRVESAVNTHRKKKELPDIESYFASRRCEEPAVVEVTSERNGIERFMMEFAAYEKYTEQDLETKRCTVQLWYDKADETEVLIRLLSFGPVIEIKGPESFRSLAAERVRKQYEMLFPEGSELSDNGNT